MATRIILDWTEDRIRDDYMEFKIYELTLGEGPGRDKALNRIRDKVSAMPIEKIIKDRKYLKSFKDGDTIDLGEDYKVEFDINTRRSKKRGLSR